jgi:hypothetical protein
MDSSITDPQVLNYITAAGGLLKKKEKFLNFYPMERDSGNAIFVLQNSDKNSRV